MRRVGVREKDAEGHVGVCLCVCVCVCVCVGDEGRPFASEDAL